MLEQTLSTFFSEEDFDKYFALHKEFVKTLNDCGLLEATYVRASATSLLYFSLVKTEEGAEGNFNKSK